MTHDKGLWAGMFLLLAAYPVPMYKNVGRRAYAYPALVRLELPRGKQLPVGISASVVELHGMSDPVEPTGQTRPNMKLDMKPLIFLLLSVLLTTSLVDPSFAIPITNPHHSNTTPTWASSPNYAKHLAARVQIDDFSVSPPAGFHLQRMRRKSKFNTGDDYKWTGHKRTDGSTSKFRVAIFRMLPGTTNTGTSEQWIVDGLNAMNTNGKRYTHTPVALGQINGLDFVRAYWRSDPTQSDTKPVYHGFQYVSSNDSTIIVIISNDVEPHYKSTLDMMEAAALTFHR